MNRRSLFAAILIFAAACSRETPSPESTTTPPPAAAAPATAPGPSPVVSTRTGGTYEGAMNWLRSTPAFDFTIEESGVRAEGTMIRPTVGAEIVELRTGGEQWRGTAGVQGVTWEKKNGSAWATATPPPWANRLYQRVTIAFDPQKKEGDAALVETDQATKHYRFTNANTGEQHDVIVNVTDDSVQRITIAGAMDLRIRPSKAAPVS